MNHQAIIMIMGGFFLLYGGLAACIAIAWYHESLKKEFEEKKK